MEQVPIEKEQAETTKKDLQTGDSAVPEMIKRRTRIKSTKTRALPSDRITFKKQLDLLCSYGVAYASSNSPVATKDVAGMVDLSEGTAALMNAFFVENEFLQRTEGRFTPAPGVIAFANAFQWEPETASNKLSPIVEVAWFAKAILPLLTMRPIEETSVIAKLAEVASADPQYKNQLRMTVDYLEASGLIQRDGTLIRLNKPSSLGEGKPKDLAGGAGAAVNKKDNPLLGDQPAGGVQFGVNIKIDMAELSGWAPERIAALFAGIAKVLSAKAGVDKE